MPIFRSKQAEDADKIAVRLAAARADLATAERELAERSPEIILTDDHATLATLRAGVSDKRDRVGLVELALRSALQREQDRLGEARLRARRSELNAFAQHLGALQRAVEHYQRIAINLQEAWEGIVDAAERARRLLAPDGYKVYPELFDSKLVQRGEAELARLGRKGEFLGLPGGVSAPGSSTGVPGGRLHSELRPFADEMKEILAFYSAQFRSSLALAPDPVEPAEPEAAEPPVEPIEEPVVDPSVANTAELAAGAVTINAPVSTIAGSAPDPVDPYQPGDPEYEGYQEALTRAATKVEA